MGGVINIVTRRRSRRTFEMKTQYGNPNSPKLDVRGSDVSGKVGVPSTRACSTPMATDRSSR